MPTRTPFSGQTPYAAAPAALLPTKNALASKTVIGTVVTLGAGVAAAFGYDFDQGTISETTAVISAAVGLVGQIIALWGRFTAKTRLKLIN